MHTSLKDSQRSHPRIGIVMRGFRRPDYEIWLGAAEAARKYTLDMVTFTGQPLASPDEFEAQANAVYELIDPNEFDGLLLLTSGVGLYVGSEGMQTFCQRFGDLPLVSTQMVLKGVPSLLVDNYQGMHEILEHLIEVHGYRRLAFLRGPVSHRGARERYRAYIESLDARDIPLDPSLISAPPEGWNDAAGIDALLTTLWSDEHTRPDAIIGTSAGLAEQALDWLNTHGVRVPEDVAVSGFDDFPHLAGLMPPLTTTYVPFTEMGQRAVELLVAQIRGNVVPMEIHFPARIVIRQSCGCPSRSVSRACDMTAHPVLSVLACDGADLAARLTSCREDLIQGILDLVDGRHGAGLSPTSAGELVDSFTAAAGIGEKRGNEFLDTLRRLAIVRARAGEDLTLMEDCVSFLRHAVKQMTVQQDESLLPLTSAYAIEDLLSQARVLIHETDQVLAINARISMGRKAVALSQIGHRLTTMTDLEALITTLARELPRADIQECFVALYEDPRDPSGWARLYYYNPEEIPDTIADADWRYGTLFPTRELLPKKALSKVTLDGMRNLVIEPLFAQNQQFGFIVFQTGPRDILFEDQIADSTIYDLLRGYVSDALHGILLYDKAHRAREQAEEADRLKSRFLSTVSHELRTPLNLIVSLSEMLLWRQETHQEELTRIHASAQHLDGLIRDVLDLASSQVGQLRLAREPLDLAQVLEVVTLIGEQMAQDKGLSWSAEIPDQPIRVWGDRTRLRQVALNMVSNAFRFTSEGSVRLVIEVEGDTVCTSISDTGLGVPPAEQEVIFDEFRQSERTATRGYGGLGLGLAISRRLVEMHGGTIGVTSSGVEGEGATFYFTLPALAPQLSAATTRNTAEKQDTTRPIVILTQPESESSHQALITYLSERNYAVRQVAMDGDKAPDDPEHWLNQILLIEPSSLILDMEPASEQGWTLMRLLKQNPQTQRIPVLFYSLLQDTDSGVMLALDYLTKPVSVADLAEILGRQGMTGLDCGSGNVCASATFLIVDDEPDILATHTWLLQTQLPGSRILQANNGRQALEIMTTSTPDLVLLDLMMPEMNGFEVIAAMQTHPELCTVPVVVMTAKTLSALELTSLNQSTTTVLGKGLFSTGETLQHIETALRRTRTLDQDTRNSVRRAIAYIHEHYMEPIARKEIAAHVNLSPRHLDRCFCEEMDLTPIAYLNRFRLRQARRLLLDNVLNISEIAAAVGFSDSSYFCRVFKRDVGISPSDYRVSQTDTTA